jgi:hypothetical protein
MSTAAETGSSVHLVMIGSRIIFHNGKLLVLDEDLLRRKAQEAAVRLNAASEVAPAGAMSVAKFVGMLCAAQGWAGHLVRRHLGGVCETQWPVIYTISCWARLAIWLRNCRTHPTTLKTSKFSQFNRNLCLAEREVLLKRHSRRQSKRNKAARDCEYG